MFNGYKVLDVHGHMTTPPEFNAALAAMIAANTPSQSVRIEDGALQSAVDSHLAVIDERNIDVQLLGPRPIAMSHWLRPYLQESWCRITNDVIAQTIRFVPGRFLGMAQLPQSAESDTTSCLRELERAVTDLGFVGAYLNPDPGGEKKAPGVNDPYWFPLYEKAIQLKITLMVHPSVSYDRRLEALNANYQINNVTEEYIATQLFSRTDVFQRYPDLQIVVCHCGGALDRWIPTDPKLNQRDWSKNLYYDTCAYNEHFLSAAFMQRGIDQMLFGSETPGAGSAVRPDTGRPGDDLIPTIDGIKFLTAEDKQKIFNLNAKKVFPALTKF